MSEANTEAIGEPMQPVDQGRAESPVPMNPARSGSAALLDELDCLFTAEINRWRRDARKWRSEEKTKYADQCKHIGTGLEIGLLIAMKFIQEKSSLSVSHGETPDRRP